MRPTVRHLPSLINWNKLKISGSVLDKDTTSSVYLGELIPGSEVLGLNFA